METVSTVIVIGLVLLCGVSIVHADTSLSAFNGRLNLINAWKQTAVNLETKMNYKVSTLGSSLKENLTNTFIPALMKGLVTQAITDILKKSYIEDMISGRVLDEINSLKASVHNTKTQLQAVTQQFRHVERERDTFKKSLVKLRRELTQDIHSLQLQLNETVTGLRDAKMVNTVLRQDLMTLNTSCVKMSQAIEQLNNDNQSCWEGLQGMQQELRTDFQSLNNQLNQTIDDLHDSKQRITGLTGDVMALNTSCVMREGIEENDVNETSLSTSSLTQVSFNTSPPMFPGAAGASSDPSHGERAAEMTRVTTHASSDPSQTTSDPSQTTSDPSQTTSDPSQTTSDPSQTTSDPSQTTSDPSQTTSDPSQSTSDPSQTTRTPVTTTKKPATQATPSQADCKDLHDASEDGDLEEVKRILSRGVDVNCRRGSWTPVMWAAVRGHRDLVELLVSRGADVSLVSGGGYNILHYACYGGDMETVEFVLSLNVVDINARDKWGRTAAYWARRNGRTRVADLLVSRGAQ